MSNKKDNNSCLEYSENPKSDTLILLKQKSGMLNRIINKAHHQRLKIRNQPDVVKSNL